VRLCHDISSRSRTLRQLNVSRLSAPWLALVDKSTVFSRVPSVDPAAARVAASASVKMVIRQIGPGMTQQAQVACPECKGAGSVIADKDKCPSCHGDKTVKEKKTLEVHINKGMRHGEKLVFKGEADEAAD